MKEFGLHKVILMTGVTGFIGSYLAASFLRKGNHVIALTRGDEAGTRTIDAINTALHQDEYGTELDFEQRLLVLPYDFGMLRERYSTAIAQVNEVWHCAAEMSFSPRKLESSFQSNVGLTSDLYHLVNELSLGCRRFFYVSTAYTGGTEPGVRREILHTHPQLINPYQVTKWSTEMSLATRVLQGARVPVTIVRPSVVIGDTHTGYYPGSPFGIYMYLQAVYNAKAMGATSLRLDLDLDSPLQMIPIDDLIANAVSLSDRASSEAEHQPLEIFHLTGQAVSNGLSLAAARKVTGLNVSIGHPETTLDFFADKICSWVKRFGNGSILFDDSELRRVLGPRFVATAMDESHFITLFRWFCHHLDEVQAKKDKAHRLRQPFALRIFDKIGTRKAKERFASRMLKMGHKKA